MVFLQKFQSDRQGTRTVTTFSDFTCVDEQFADEKNFLLQKLSALKSSSAESNSSAGTGIAAY